MAALRSELATSNTDRASTANDLQASRALCAELHEQIAVHLATIARLEAALEDAEARCTGLEAEFSGKEVWFPESSRCDMMGIRLCRRHGGRIIQR